MNWLDFIARLVDALAWPLVVLVLALVFRRRLSELLAAFHARFAQLREISAPGGFTAKFATEVGEAKEALDRADRERPLGSAIDERQQRSPASPRPSQPPPSSQRPPPLGAAQPPYGKRTPPPRTGSPTTHPPPAWVPIPAAPGADPGKLTDDVERWRYDYALSQDPFRRDDPSTWSRLIEVAATEPRSAVVEAGRILEYDLASIAIHVAAAEVPLSDRRRLHDLRSPMVAVSFLQQHKRLDADRATAIRQLIRLRNEAAQASAPPAPGAAEQYVLAVQQAVDALAELRRRAEMSAWRMRMRGVTATTASSAPTGGSPRTPPP